MPFIFLNFFCFGFLTFGGETMKKIFALLTVFAALIFVVSCGGGSKKTDDTTDTGETVTDEDAVDTDSTDSGSGDNTDSSDNTDTASDGGDTASDDDADTAHDGGDSASDDDADTTDPCTSFDTESACAKHSETCLWVYGDSKCESYAEVCETNGGTWNASQNKCTTTHNCTDEKPEHAVWNGETSITQTFNFADLSWTPEYFSTYTEYSEEEGVCHFKCEEGYLWYSYSCFSYAFVCETNDGTWNASQNKCTRPCDSKPANSVWNGDTTYTTTYSDGIWSTVKTEYNKTAGACRFTCKDGYFYNGGYCQKQLSIGKICTTQTKCYNETSEITCPTTSTVDFYGQDPLYKDKCTEQKFRAEEPVEGQKVVADKNTGLVWQHSPSTEKYTWGDANDPENGPCVKLNEQKYAGLDEWRVPNPSELLTLLDIVRNTDFFEDMPNTSNTVGLWTSDTTSGTGNYALVFYTGTPALSDIEANKNHRVLCVSGNKLLEATTDDFSLSADGKTVSDIRTGLVWEKEQSSAPVVWKDAFKHCQDLNRDTYAGYIDWRLPNRNELASLFTSSAKYSNFPGMDENHGKKYHSSSTATGRNDAYSWLADFRSESIFLCEKGSEYCNFYAKCVRSDNSPSTVCKFADGTWNEETGTCTRPCDSKPENTLWNDGGNGGVYTQTYADGAWSAAFSTLHDEDVAGACHYKCAPLKSFWKGDHCQKVSLGNLCTGQTKCYDRKEQMDFCPVEGEDFYGQDAQHSEDSLDCYGNGKITQGVALGLHWEVVSSKSDYTWEEAYQACRALPPFEDGDGYEYHYLLPTTFQMFAILKYGTQIGSLYTTSATGSYWWTNNLDVVGNNKNYYYALDTRYNTVGSYPGSTTKMNVICVATTDNVDGLRYATKSEEFKEDTVAGGSVVTDTRSGLIWQKGHSPNKMYWEEALAYCQKLNYAGYDDWRLPNKNELVSLLELFPAGSVCSNFPGMDGEEFLSSTTFCEYGNTGKCNSVYSLDFATGKERMAWKIMEGSEAYAKCVRN